MENCSFGDDGLCSKLESRKTVFSGEDENQKLSQCNYDVSVHIYSLLHTKLQITEAQLISNRVQKDNIDQETICPYHGIPLAPLYEPLPGPPLPL